MKYARHEGLIGHTVFDGKGLDSLKIVDEMRMLTLLSLAMVLRA